MITLSGSVERVDITVVKLMASDHVLCRTRPWNQWGGYVILMTSYVFVGCNSKSPIPTSLIELSPAPMLARW